MLNRKWCVWEESWHFQLQSEYFPSSCPLFASQCAFGCSRTHRGDLLPWCSVVLAKKAAAAPGASPWQTEQMPYTNKQHSGVRVGLPVKPTQLKSTQNAELSSWKCVCNTPTANMQRSSWLIGVCSHQLLLSAPAVCASLVSIFLHEFKMFYKYAPCTYRKVKCMKPNGDKLTFLCVTDWCLLFQWHAYV